MLLGEADAANVSNQVCLYQPLDQQEAQEKIERLRSPLQVIARKTFCARSATNAVNTAGRMPLAEMTPRERRKAKNDFNMNNRAAIVLCRCAKCCLQNAS